jgi:hypothetical protein
MKITKIIGTRCFPQAGPIAMAGPIWPALVGMPIAMPAAGESPTTGRPVYRDRFYTLINVSSTALPAIRPYASFASSLKS